MKGPSRWRDDDGAPDDVRAMLSSAKKTRPMTGQDRARLSRRLTRSLLAPTGLALGLWSKAVLAAAGASVVSWIAVATVRKVAEHRAETRANAEAQQRATRARGTTSMRRVSPPRESTEPSLAATEAPLAQTPTTLAVAAAPTSPAQSITPNLTQNLTPNLTANPTPNPAQTPSPIGPQPLARNDAMHARRIAPGSTSTLVRPRPMPALTDAEPGSIDTTSAPATSPLLREAQLVERARVLLATDPALALQRVAEADEAFPSGALGAERDLVAIHAMLRLGQRAPARERAQRALQRDPDGPYAARWRVLIESVEPR